MDYHQSWGKQAPQQTEYKSKQRAVLLGAALNLPLALLKVFGGIIGHSQALVADGIDSTADIVCDVFVISAVRISRQNPDWDHPYGHARIETAATALVSLILLLTGAAVGYRGINSVFSASEHVQPALWVLAIAGAAVVLKESMYWYTLYVAKKSRSALMKTNAWHHRSDALTSSVAFIAIAGSLAGIPKLDALGAIIIAGVITFVGLRYGWESLRELVDTGLPPERVQAIENEIFSVSGVQAMRRLRTRTMGGHDAFADVGVLVSPDITLTEAHRISEAITQRLIDHIDEITDLCVHIEPAGYADSKAAHNLPLREQMLKQLQEAWWNIPAAVDIQRVQLHYLDDSATAEITLPLRYASQQAQLQAAFDAAAERTPYISAIYILYAERVAQSH